MALIIETMPLTARELDVLRLLCSGKRYADIARELGMTRNTAAGHLKSVYRKLDVSSAAAAVMKAVEMQLFGADETLPKVKADPAGVSSPAVSSAAHRVTFRAKR
jgi:DNA-binding CsgD family transcriptional regulator